MICAGIDAGSRTIKVVLIDSADQAVLTSAIADQGVNQALLAKRLLERALEKAGLKRRDIGRVVATGYGRDALEWADRTVTEITCQARGVRAVVPKARTVIDIGGQDSKLLRLNEEGSVEDFVMNDRCAAGTGRFLEIVAGRLELPFAQLGPAAARSTSPASISSMCVVFAETEIVSLLAQGQALEDIVAGVQNAMASRVGAMAGRKVTGPVVLTGGVALIPGVDSALTGVLGMPVKVAPRPQLTGALGAALIAADARG
jgi:predicted CoA-substrate-specific enzyme activase